MPVRQRTAPTLRARKSVTLCLYFNQNICFNAKLISRSEVRLFDKSGHPTKGRTGGGVTGLNNRERSRSPTRMGVTGGRAMGGPTGTRHGSMIPMSHDPYPPYGAAAGPPPPVEPVVGNEAEIIVIDRSQWFDTKPILCFFG